MTRWNTLLVGFFILAVLAVLLVVGALMIRRWSVDSHADQLKANLAQVSDNPRLMISPQELISNLPPDMVAEMLTEAASHSEIFDFVGDNRLIQIHRKNFVDDKGDHHADAIIAYDLATESPGVAFVGPLGSHVVSANLRPGGIDVIWKHDGRNRHSAIPWPAGEKTPIASALAAWESGEDIKPNN